LYKTLIVAGLIILVSGYGAFLFTTQAGAHPTGIYNRIALGGSIGIAFAIVGLTGWVVHNVTTGGRYEGQVFACAIAMVCLAGSMSVNCLSTQWKRASQKQAEILTNLETALGEIPPHAIILVDGICPYIGPAPVFEGQWDVTGALFVLSRDHSQKGDVVTSRLQLLSDRVITSIYEFESEYAYGHNLYAYHDRWHKTYSLWSVEQARRYFDHVSDLGKRDCLKSKPGQGDEVVPLAYSWVYGWWKSSNGSER
jgi:hypothetical protein